MIERILEQQQAICSVLAEDRKNWHRMPSDQEFLCLEGVATVLKPLSTFTDALSGETCVTISAVLPLLQHIKDVILQQSSTDTSIMKEMKMIIVSDLTSRYTSTLIMDKSTYLDPRFRLNYPTKDSVLQELHAEAVAEVETTPLDCNSTSDDVPPPPKKQKGLSAILTHSFGPTSASLNESISVEEQVQREIDRYKVLPHIAMDVDPLNWWKNQNLPILSSLAKKYQCVAGTSVPSERLFSQAGYIVNDLRSRLTPDNVNMLVFLARNMK